MLALIINEPTEKELRDALIEIEKILDKKMDAEKAQDKPRERTLQERVDIHNQRLGRQGKDIFGLYKLFEKFSKRLKEEEMWTKTLQKGIALSAECSGKLLSKHKKILDEQGKGIDELQDRSIEQRKEIQKLSKNEMVGIEDINRTAKDLKETRDVVMELAEHLGFEITTERNKDYMKAYKVAIKKKEVKE